MQRATTRLFQLVSHLFSSRKAPSASFSIMNGHRPTGVSLADLPKSHTFTSYLPPDPAIPTPEASKSASDRQLRVSRPVQSALFTWVAPEKNENPQLLVTSSRALQDLGLDISETETEDFLNLMSGNKIYEEHYPWAQNYGGWQFGVWASQLGDGRACSLFEATNPETKVRYEVQLKGCGKTPYSRFADGNAVLRASIREFLISEYLNAIGIPTTRALALTVLPNRFALRERIEPCAIVCRMAQSWIRIGTFDLFRNRGDRETTRKLAEYCIPHVFGGEDKLPRGREGEEQPNRFERLYREICLRNARTVAQWQAYGFMNGVLNTDNTSIYGLSLDFGPFAFMDTFDPMHTPNHDDHQLRYSYRLQPTIIWWNLTRLGEALGELMGSMSHVDDPTYISGEYTEEQKAEVVKHGERIIGAVGEEFKSVFLQEYKQLMQKRLGLQTLEEDDMDLFSETLSMLEDTSCDFNHFFYRLGKTPIFNFTSTADFETGAEHILPADTEITKRTSIEKLAHWLEKQYKPRLEKEGSTDDMERKERMGSVNPKFILKQWVLEEVIKNTKSEKGVGVKNKEMLEMVLRMTLEPFREEWGGDRGEEERFCGDVPKIERGFQCSCSS